MQNIVIANSYAVVICSLRFNFGHYQDTAGFMTTQNSRNRKILVSGCLFHIFHDSIADGLAVLLPFWKIAFQLSLTQVGLIITCFEGATALFQIPAGFLGERYGERRLLTLGTFVTTVSFMGIAFSRNIYVLCALLIIGGLGAGVQHPLASSMISKAYAQGNRRIALGTYNFTGDMGKFLFPVVAAVVLSITGWRVLCFGYGLFGLVMTLGLYGLLRRNHSGGMDIETGRAYEKFSGWGIENKKAFFTLASHRIYRYGRSLHADYLSAVLAHRQGYAHGIHRSGPVFAFYWRGIRKVYLWHSG